MSLSSGASHFTISALYCSILKHKQSIAYTNSNANTHTHAETDTAKHERVQYAHTGIRDTRALNRENVSHLFDNVNISFNLLFCCDTDSALGMTLYCSSPHIGYRLALCVTVFEAVDFYFCFCYRRIFFYLSLCCWLLALQEMRKTEAVSFNSSGKWFINEKIATKWTDIFSPKTNNSPVVACASVWCGTQTLVRPTPILWCHSSTDKCDRMSHAHNGGEKMTMKCHWNADSK